MGNDFIKLSTNSWHYRLIVFVFGANAPSPYKMRNLCPYFWLLMFCMLIGGPFKALFRSVHYVLNLMFGWIGEYFDAWLKNYAMNALGDLPSGDNSFYLSVHDLPVGLRIYKSRSDMTMNELRSMYFKNKYGVDIDTDEGKQWHEDHIKQMNLSRQAARERLRIKEEKSRARAEARARRMAAIQERTAFINEWLDGVTDMLKSMSGSVKVDIDLTWFINIAKKVTGALITGLIFAASYFLVMVTSVFVAYLYSIWSWPAIWEVTLSALIVIAAVAVILYISYLINEWYEGLRYSDKSEWWISKIFIYGVYYPGFYVLYIPLMFLLYRFMWQAVIIWAIWGVIKATGRALKSFTGIFGDYFGSAYSGYCPGIEWDVDEK